MFSVLHKKRVLITLGHMPSLKKSAGYYLFKYINSIKVCIEISPFPIDLLHSITQELPQRNPFSLCSGTKKSNTAMGLGGGQDIC